MSAFLSGRMDASDRLDASEARSPSGKAKVCKTFIGGSIPPRASKFAAEVGPPLAILVAIPV